MSNNSDEIQNKNIYIKRIKMIDNKEFIVESINVNGIIKYSFYIKNSYPVKCTFIESCFSNSIKFNNYLVNDRYIIFYKLYDNGKFYVYSVYDVKYDCYLFLNDNEKDNLFTDTKEKIFGDLGSSKKRMTYSI